MIRRPVNFPLLCLLCALLIISCGAEPRPDYRSPERSYQTMHATEDTSEAGAAYAKDLLADDPKREAITDAWVRGDDFLGVVVRPDIESRPLRELSLLLAEDMASRFTGRDIEVVAYDERTKEAVARAIYLVDTGKISYETVR